MLPTVGRDERDALVPPGAEAGNGTSLPCIIGACHVGVIIALIIDNFILFNALKHLNTYKCRDSVFKIKPEAVWWRWDPPAAHSAVLGCRTQHHLMQSRDSRKPPQTFLCWSLQAERVLLDKERSKNSGLRIKVEREILSLTLDQHDPEIQAVEAVLWTFTPVPSPCLQGRVCTGGCTQSSPSFQGELSLVHRG